MWKFCPNRIPVKPSTQGAGIPVTRDEKEIAIPNIVTCWNNFGIGIKLWADI